MPGNNPRYIEHNGLTMCVKEWAEYLGVGRKAIHARLRRGWTIERALGTGKMHGENHYMARLTPSQVLDMRMLREQGVTIENIAFLYEVSRDTARSAILKLTWKDA